MAIARLLFLIMLVPIMAAIGSGTNTAAAIAATIFFIAAPALYFLPTIEAKINGSPNTMPVLRVNLFLGWTLIGWVVALAWAHKKHHPEYLPTMHPAAAQPTNEKQDEKTCPFCAEKVKAAAIKCRHCGSSLT